MYTLGETLEESVNIWITVKIQGLQCVTIWVNKCCRLVRYSGSRPIKQIDCLSSDCTGAATRFLSSPRPIIAISTYKVSSNCNNACRHVFNYRRNNWTCCRDSFRGRSVWVSTSERSSWWIRCRGPTREGNRTRALQGRVGAIAWIYAHPEFYLKYRGVAHGSVGWSYCRAKT